MHDDNKLDDWLVSQGLDDADPSRAIVAELDELRRFELFVLLEEMCPGWPTELLDSLETIADLRWYAQRRSIAWTQC